MNASWRRLVAKTRPWRRGLPSVRRPRNMPALATWLDTRGKTGRRGRTMQAQATKSLTGVREPRTHGRTGGAGGGTRHPRRRRAQPGTSPRRPASEKSPGPPPAGRRRCPSAWTTFKANCNPLVGTTSVREFRRELLCDLRPKFGALPVGDKLILMRDSHEVALQSAPFNVQRTTWRG
jgi:hypothetical protein